MTDDPAIAVSPDLLHSAPADAAIALAELPPDEAAAAATAMPPEAAARILKKIDPASAAVIICAMQNRPAAALLEAMPPDDRVNIFEHLPPIVHEELMAEMGREQADELRQLEQYPPDTAGGLMTTQVAALFEYITAENAITTLRQLNKTLGQLIYVYVTDRHRRLLGVLSMRDLILADPDTLLKHIMKQPVSAVPATLNQKMVAEQMQKHGYVAMPVVDGDGVLIGLITLDDVVKVIEREATGAVQKLFGAGAEERLTTPWPLSLRSRFWWLQVNLITSFLGAGIVSVFASTIAALPILAAYQTIVASMGANAGAQAMAVAIRGIATGEARGSILRRVLRRELMVGLISGIGIGLTTAVLILILRQSERSLLIGAIVCLALVLNHVNACITGVCVPFLMKRLGFDPAQSASIIATTFTDCGGFFACLGLARFAIYLLGIPI